MCTKWLPWKLEQQSFRESLETQGTVPPKLESASYSSPKLVVQGDAKIQWIHEKQLSLGTIEENND